MGWDAARSRGHRVDRDRSNGWYVRGARSQCYPRTWLGFITPLMNENQTSGGEADNMVAAAVRDTALLAVGASIGVASVLLVAHPPDYSVIYALPVAISSHPLATFLVVCLGIGLMVHLHHSLYRDQSAQTTALDDVFITQGFKPVDPYASDDAMDGSPRLHRYEPPPLPKPAEEAAAWPEPPPYEEVVVAETELVFTVNGVEHRVSNPDPSILLVDYLRDTLGLTGTKVGCGEGGCGACTCICVGADEVPRAINACLRLLCACDGLTITTTEGLGSQARGFSAAQTAIADGQGSQCGFCTPGCACEKFRARAHSFLPDPALLLPPTLGAPAASFARVSSVPREGALSRAARGAAKARLTPTRTPQG